MARDHFNPTSLRSLAGSILVGPGLFLLGGHLLWAVALWSRSAGDGLGVLSSVIWASSVGEQQFFHALLHTLWPVLLVVVGGVLLRAEPNPEA
jgi:hypothetical protein